MKIMLQVKRGRVYRAPVKNNSRVKGFVCCPNCGHGITDTPKSCHWCGWPDLEAARERTQLVTNILKNQAGGK